MHRTALVLAALALVAPATASAQSQEMWQTPSGNISCVSMESSLRCDMRKTGTRKPKRPRSCEFDYGNAFGVTKRGHGRRLCVSDFVGGPNTPVVRYGRTWMRDGFACRVRESGVRCVNPRGHGFELRIGRQRLF